jgi:hypothetical protein
VSFLGYGSGVKGYKLWNPKTKEVVLSRSVVFKEYKIYYANRSSNVQQSVPDKVSLQVENLDEDDIMFQDAAIPDPQVHDISPIIDYSLSIDHSSPVVQQPQQFVVVGRAKRDIRPPKRLIEECNIAFALSYVGDIDCSVEPSTYSEAMVSNDRDKWVFAMQEEM